MTKMSRSTRAAALTRTALTGRSSLIGKCRLPPTERQHMVLTPQRILVVDDEPKICDFVGRALSNAGYGIEIARSGAEAVDRAARHGYGLVILDLVMPGLDGRSVLTRLLRLRPGQAVLVLSCRSDV